MGSQVVPSSHDAPHFFINSACIAAEAGGGPPPSSFPVSSLDDYLFCHELLGTDGLHLAFDSPSPVWHGSQQLPALTVSSALRSDGGGFGFLCTWISSPTPCWTSSSFTATPSLSSDSFSPPHHSTLVQHDHFQPLCPPPSCSKLASAVSCIPSPILHAPTVSMQACASGGCSHVDRDEIINDSSQPLVPAERSCEGMCALVERQQWPQCRPLKVYAESMHEYAARGNSCNTWISSKKRSTSTATDGAAWITMWSMTRRSTVESMLEIAKTMGMNLSSTAQAVTYLDRYLSQRIKDRRQVSTDEEGHVAGAASLWLALKMEHCHAPDAAFMSESLAYAMVDGHSKKDRITKLKAMEAKMLQVLQWRLLGVSAVEFVDSIVLVLQSASTSACALPARLLQSLRSRALEIVQGTLLEVAFAGYEACMVGECAIQHALEEIRPSQSAQIMHSLHDNLSVPLDMEEREKCYKSMGDLVVDPFNRQILASSPISHVYPSCPS